MALESLTKAIAAASDSEEWTVKARLGIVALHLGDTSAASDMLQFERRADPIQRTALVDVFPKWHADLNELATQLHATEDGAFRSGLSLAVGSIEDVDDKDRETWQQLLSEWYMNQADAGTHSAAGWALRNWKCDLPTIEPATGRVSGRNWLVTRSGLTMLRIPAGGFVREVAATQEMESRQQTVRLTRDFLLSDREITVGLFQQFIQDAEYAGEKPEDWQGADEETSPSAEHPVQQVNWYDAVMFCNWLSRREGLDPCYERIGEKETNNAIVNDTWRLIDGASGYRLPSEAEWEYACRAGTTTSFVFGEDEAWLNAYGVYVVNSGPNVAVCGTKLCNAWGLFDMHGNALEWCGDWFAAYGEEPVVDNPVGPHERPEGGSHRVSRGGSWISGAWSCRSALRSRAAPVYRSSILGFRVARVPSASKAPASGAESGSR